MIKVSIIIPIYKVEPYIERCINSVLRQTYRNLEVILVDDCTPDRSMEIAKSLINDYENENENHYGSDNENLNNNDINFVFLKHERNRGLSAARNTGIYEATGDYLLFLDSDDEITDDCVDKLVREAVDGTYDVVCGNLKTKGSYNSYWERYQHWELKSHDNDEIIRVFTTWHLYDMAWNKLVRRELIKSKSIYFKEGIIYEDQLWSLWLINQTTSMCVIPDVTYIYWKREGAITTASPYRIKNESRIIILKEYQKLLKNGMIKDISDNHRYMMEKRKRWMNEIFNCKELTQLEKLRYLLSVANLKHGIRFSFHFIFSRYRHY